MDELFLGVRLLLLLAVANIAPIAAKRLMGEHYAWALDGGYVFLDGRPLLGPSKTIRGLVAAILLCALVAPVLGLSVSAGALAGLGAMAGDALSSFIKRRLGIPSSGQSYGLDQVPEALVPLLLLEDVLQLSFLLIISVTLIFLLLEPPLARLSHKLGLRDRPY